MMERRPENLQCLEGRHVGVVLSDGGRLEDWELVSVGGAEPDTAWLWDPRGSSSSHAFVPLSRVVDFWEIAG